MDKNEPGIDVGTKCGHPCIRLDGRIKNDFGCCICMGETQLCTSCEERRLSEDPVGEKDESVNTPGSRKHLRLRNRRFMTATAVVSRRLCLIDILI